MDLFEEYLKKKGSSDIVDRALTDQSQKNVDHDLADEKTNSDLATVGDAIIRFLFTLVFFEDNEPAISSKRQKYESDKALVNVVARNYDMLEYIDFDKNNEEMPQDYDYKPGNKKHKSKHKYIATAVEAMIGAIYLTDKNNLGKIKELFVSWKKNLAF